VRKIRGTNNRQGPSGTMTALEKYERLESTGLWRADPEAQRRDVIVSFGEATLVLSDQNESALAHWSLPAISRLNPSERPALFSPDADATETLELDDETMIRAIEKVRAAVARSQPKPGRVRLLVFAGTFTAVLALAVFWLPDALARHTASAVPDVTRARIGDQLLSNIGRLSGGSCMTRPGERALNRLRTRLSPETRALVVLRSGVAASEHLPGGIILLNRDLLENNDTPEVAAGYILAEAQHAAENDPLLQLLRATGPLTSFRLLTSGEIPDAALKDYSEKLLTGTKTPVNDDALLARFAAAGVRSTPYAFALDASGETTLSLIEADPYRRTAPRVILEDGDWTRLQEICNG